MVRLYFVLADCSQLISLVVEPVDEFPDFSELPDLPEDEDEFWDDELDGEGEIDVSWSNENEANEPTEENEESASNNSSVTLSSKGSKRTYSEVDEYEEEGDHAHTSIPTPGRSRPFFLLEYLR